eukprot:gene37476-49032_t
MQSERIHDEAQDNLSDNNDGELASIPTTAQVTTINVERLPRLRRTTKLPGYYAEIGQAVEPGKGAITTRHRYDVCPRDPARSSIYVSDSTLGPFKGAFACRPIRSHERFATYTGIQKASALLSAQPVDVLEGTMTIVPPMTTAAVPHVAETWGISHSGLRQRCEEKKRKHQQNRDEETTTRIMAQAIQNACTGTCSSTDYDNLKETDEKARVVEQRESSTAVGPERCPLAVQAPMRYYMSNNYTSNMEGYRLVMHIPNVGPPRQQILRILQP